MIDAASARSGVLAAAALVWACADPTAGGGAGWTDVTEASGVDFRHETGARGDKFLVETLGSGVCFLDYDGDGREDLYFVNSGEVPGREPLSAANALYRNLGGGRFLDVTGPSGTGDAAYGMGCAAADIDNDGDTDLYVTNYGRNVLFRNRGDGVFEDVTERAGVGAGDWSTSAAFADYDGDGWVDLYVVRYLDFRVENNLYCGEDRPGYRTYCHPDNFAGLPDLLYRNNGDGTFTDVTRPAGVYEEAGKGLGVVWTDYDADGRVDIYVANDATPNSLFRNRGDGTFEDVTLRTGTGFSEDGLPEAGMGVDAGDYDGDGRMDLFVVNLSHETNTLYANQGAAGFLHRTDEAGLGEPSLLFLGFGTGFFDYDNDGDLDIYVNNGHLLENIHLYSDTVTYAQRKMLFENGGDGRFAEVADRMGEGFLRPNVGRGSATGDWDDDGDLDLAAAHSGRRAALLRNDLANGNHWIGFRLSGKRANRDGIGARLVLEAGGRARHEEVRAGSSYLSQDDLRVHFGLGRLRRADRLRVRWPGGPWEEWRDLEADRYHRIVEGTGTAVP